MKVMRVLLLAVLAIGGLVLTGINVNEVIVTYEYVGQDSKSDVSSQSEMNEVGENSQVHIGEQAVSYDISHMEDSTGDGINDRHTYYQNGQLMMASWDYDNNGLPELAMDLSDGIHIDQQYIDTDNDGTYDLTRAINVSGEVTSIRVIEEKFNGPISQNIGLFEVVTPMHLLIYIVMPFYVAIISSAFLIFLGVRKIVYRNTLAIIMCVVISLSTMTIEVMADEILREDGTINEEVFERDWKKYSDLDDTKPMESRSHEAQMVAQSEQWIIELYDQMAVLANDIEVNRQAYIALTEFKSDIVNLQRANLIKSTIRLAIFTGYTINDAKGKAVSFATNVLDSGATVMKGIGEVLGVTSDFVSEDYKDDFGTLQKGVTYYNAESKIDQIKSDAKDYMKKKVAEKLNVASLNYSMDDMKISDEDVEILRKHFQKNRVLDNAILENQVIQLYLEEQLEVINKNVIAEQKTLDQYYQAEKERVYYYLSNKPPKSSGDEEEDTEPTTAEVETVMTLEGEWSGNLKIVAIEIDPSSGMSKEERLDLYARVGQIVDATIVITREGYEYFITIDEETYPIIVSDSSFHNEMEQHDRELHGYYDLNGTFDLWANTMMLDIQMQIVFDADDAPDDRFVISAVCNLSQYE